MFDIGFSELVLIFVIGLVVLGPERLPKAARTLGFWMGRAKSTFNNLRNELEREALNQEMRERMEKQMREMGLDDDSIRQARDSLLSPEQTTRARRQDQERDQRALEGEDDQAEKDSHDGTGRLIDHDQASATSDDHHTDESPAESRRAKGKGPEKHNDA